MTTITANRVKPKKKRETWRDWLPANAPELSPDHWWTREDIVNELAGHNIKVSPDDIRYWENEGVLPKGIRKRHKGAIRAIYPYWYAILVYSLRKMQEQGYTLSQIKRHLRAHAGGLMGGAADDVSERLRKQLDVATSREGLVWSSDKMRDGFVVIHGRDTVLGPEKIGLDVLLSGSIGVHGKLLDQFTGTHHIRANLEFVADDGTSITYTIPLQPNRNPK